MTTVEGRTCRAKYFRIKVMCGVRLGVPEVISEEVAMRYLKVVWSDPNALLDEGERLTVGEFLYWKEK